jgi:hypothetical protein
MLTPPSDGIRASGTASPGRPGRLTSADTATCTGSGVSPQPREPVDQAELVQAVADLVALSDDRDRQQRRVLESYGAGYRAGYAAGHDDGMREALEAEAHQRRVAAGLVVGARPGTRHVDFAELDRRRYPPGGRKS